MQNCQKGGGKVMQDFFVIPSPRRGRVLQTKNKNLT